MKFRLQELLSYLMAIAIALIAFNTDAYAQMSVSISGLTSGTTMNAPTSTPFNLTATVSNNANPLTKIVFYRNDVAYKTFTGSSTSGAITEYQLGQDTYTYRARAYDSNGTWADSPDIKLTVEYHQTRIFMMGSIINGVQTNGPSNNYTFDHTQQIQSAVTYISGQGGGTLYFPCTFPTGQGYAAYNIRNTITIPSNVTLQGESAEDTIGRCQILWNDVSWNPFPPDETDPPITPDCYDNPNTNTYPLRNKPMFKVEGNASRVRFRDLWLYSRSSGKNCYPRYDWERIANENTTGVLMDSQGGKISDIIFENVSVTNFTYGIKAVGNEISDVKMRAFRPNSNHRQLYIDATYAYDWDVQNFSVTSMMEQQGAVEIINAGAPASTSSENKKLKFMQLNCAGDKSQTPAFCVRVEKHGGLYFRQLHHEGVDNALIVHDISGRTGGPNTNDDPIIFEHGVATGEFRDASMKLYLIGNAVFAAPEIAQPELDTGRLRFIGNGVNSTVVDCGDVHWDVTDINGGAPAWTDLQMLFTHSERNRSSFFADSQGYSYVKPHTICPSGVAGLNDVDKVGGEHFNTGVMPMETNLPYSNIFGPLDCSGATDCATKLQALLNRLGTETNGGTVYIKGSVTVDGTITIPTGRQLVGAPGAELVLSTSDPNLRLLRINAALPSEHRTSGIVIRNLKLRKAQAGTGTGLAIIGANHTDPGGASDMHFSGLTVEGFDKGLEIAPYSTTTAQPMVDGLSWKNNSFVNNKTAVSIFSGNFSNWNVMNLSMESNSAGAVGWYQLYGGHLVQQNVTCKGTSSNPMNDCIKLDMAALYLTGLKKMQHVTNALTFGVNGVLGYPAPYLSVHYANSVVRNNDFSSSVAGMSRVNLLGKAFITSMNNRYSYFNVSPGPEAKFSRLTHCGDTYDGGIAYPGLEDRHPNLYVGVPTPTRIQCGTRPIPWDDAIRWGGNAGDQPLVGNFFDDVREDFVIYREGPQSQFRIKQAGGTGGEYIMPWGMTGDKPLIGRFFPGERAQIVVWRPSNGHWYVTKPNTADYQAWQWGMSGDIPFIGNFIDESSSGSVTGNKDEIAVYRPSNRTFYFYNPRSGKWDYITRNADHGTNIQVGDFLGTGYDQIAQYNNGVWNIVDPRTKLPYTPNHGVLGDVPVAGKYLSGACTQLGVWRPSTQEFLVKDPSTSCGSREQSMIWGSNNDFGGSQYADDIPLRINTADGSLHRPTSYRPTKGAFPDSISNGQWWVHDIF